MSRVVLSDAGGDTLHAVEHDGMYFPNFPHLDSLTGVQTLHVREDDIFICAFSKSGTHWVWEIKRLLLAGRLADDHLDKGVSMLEYAPEVEISALPSPRILNTHLTLKRLPADVVNKRCKIIYIWRNPKDTLVSYFNFTRCQQHYNYTGKWENYLQPAVMGKMPYGSWFDYVLDWEKTKQRHPELPVLGLCFEDLHKDGLREIRRIDNFLSTNRYEHFLSLVQDYTSFSHMKDRADRKVKGSFAGTFRKGQVGDWKNWFTVAQNEWFDKLLRERMKGCDLPLHFTLPESTGTNRVHLSL